MNAKTNILILFLYLILLKIKVINLANNNKKIDLSCVKLNDLERS